MSVNRSIDLVSVDRRQDTAVSEQPGYTATEQVTRDVAAERRQRTFQITGIVWSVMGLLEILLTIRFLLKVIPANANSGFAVLIYGITDLFIIPFEGLLKTPTTGGMILDVTTFVAIVVYALFFWGVVRVIDIVRDRPAARTVTHSTHEQMPDAGLPSAGPPLVAGARIPVVGIPGAGTPSASIPDVGLPDAGPPDAVIPSTELLDAGAERANQMHSPQLALVNRQGLSHAAMAETMAPDKTE